MRPPLSIGRLSGSVSDRALSPVAASSCSRAAYPARHCCNVTIFSRRALALGPRLGPALALQLPEIARVRAVDVPLQRGQAGWGVAPVPRIHRPELAPVDGEQLPPEEVQPPAEQKELPAHALQRLGVIPPEVGDGLEVRGEPPQEPDQLEVPMGLLLQPPTGPDPVEIPIEVEPE
jgi:hypothetical protein